MEHFQSSLLYNPTDDLALSYIGELHERSGNSSLAIQFYKNALKINPKVILVSTNLIPTGKESGLYMRIGHNYLQDPSQDFKEAIKYVPPVTSYFH